MSAKPARKTDGRTDGEGPRAYRCFAAVRLENEVERRAARALATLRRDVDGVKWVRPEQLHLTVQFYGDVEVDALPELRAALAAAVAEVPTGTIVVRGAGTFPPRGAPRVVWLGIDDERRTLADLHRAVRAAWPVAGDRRPYRPHLTMGRVRRGKRPQELTATLAPLRHEEFGRSRVAALTLFRSELLPGGPRYTVLDEWTLRKETDG